MQIGDLVYVVDCENWDEFVGQQGKVVAINRKSHYPIIVEFDKEILGDTVGEFKYTEVELV